jgi:hypothetical protein
MTASREVPRAPRTLKGVVMAKESFSGVHVKVDHDWVSIEGSVGLFEKIAPVRVPTSSIETVVIGDAGRIDPKFDYRHEAMISLVGAGVVLGQVRIKDKNAAPKIQEWLLKALAAETSAANDGKLSPDGKWKWSAKKNKWVSP